MRIRIHSTGLVNTHLGIHVLGVRYGRRWHEPWDFLFTYPSSMGLAYLLLGCLFLIVQKNHIRELERFRELEIQPRTVLGYAGMPPSQVCIISSFLGYCTSTNLFHDNYLLLLLGYCYGKIRHGQLSVRVLN